MSDDGDSYYVQTSVNGVVEYLLIDSKITTIELFLKHGD